MPEQVKAGGARGNQEELEGRGSGGSSSAHGRQELAPAAPTRPEKQNPLAGKNHPKLQEPRQTRTHDQGKRGEADANYEQETQAYMGHATEESATREEEYGRHSQLADGPK